MNLTGNKILITGGASGIGFALAERFAQEGNTIIICGRRQDALDELHSFHRLLLGAAAPADGAPWVLEAGRVGGQAANFSTCACRV